MNFDELIDEFRYLGGVFKNLRLETNAKTGSGLFVINPSKKFEIIVPVNLMISIDMIRLDRHQQVIVNKKSIWSNRTKKFFENYQKYFGWGLDGFEKTLETQSALQYLPNELIQHLLIFGLSDDFNADLNPQFCLQKYFGRKLICRSRVGSGSRCFFKRR